MSTIFLCPSCSEEIHPNSSACPHCGARRETGWAQNHIYDGLDLPDQDFDYRDFVAREFGDKRKFSRIKPAGISVLWWIAGIIVAIAFAMLLLRG